MSCVVGAYLSGSVPFGVLLTRWLKGTDVRALGSGNIGATNVARVAGKRLGLVVLGLDAAKGALPVLAVQRLWPQAALLHVAVALAAVLGHVFPIWLKLRGGKGVATALGVLAVLVPEAALAGAAAWLVVVVAVRLSSLGSVLGGALALAVAFGGRRPWEYAALAALLFGLMLFTHRGNLRRLWRRSERRL